MAQSEMRCSVIRGWCSGRGVAGLCLATCVLCGGGCNEPSGYILVTGTVCMDDGGLSPWADVEVWHESTRVLDASVTVNDIPLALTASQHYSANVLPVTAGDWTWLYVFWGDLSVTAQVVMPDKPVVTAPTTATGPHDASADITVTWGVLSPAPEEVQVSVADTFTISGDSWSMSVDGTVTSATIPAGTLKTGSLGTVAVTAFSNAIAESPYAELGSSFSAAAASVSEAFATQ